MSVRFYIYGTILTFSILLPQTCGIAQDFTYDAKPYTEKRNIKKMKGKISYKYEDIYWLAMNIYHEARGENTLHGKMAVAFVTMNRVIDRRWPDTVKGVVNQAWQFSWTMDHIDDTPTNLDAWDDAWIIAKMSIELYNSMARDIPLEEADWLTKGANHYHSKSMRKYPKWSRVSDPIATLGNHIFYKF